MFLATLTDFPAVSYQALTLAAVSLGQARILGELNSLVAVMQMRLFARQVGGFPGVIMAPSAAGGCGTNHGNLSPWSWLHMRRAKPICLRLLTQLIRWARAFALAKAGRSSPARIAIIAITTSSSIRVKAFLRIVVCLIFSFSLRVNAADLILSR